MKPRWNITAKAVVMAGNKGPAARKALWRGALPALCCAALSCGAFLFSCDTSFPDTSAPNEEGPVQAGEEPAGGPLSGLAGTCWWWPSLQLFFISDDRVMLYSTGSYYPAPGAPFRYRYPAPGYAYSYTYDAAAGTGSVAGLGEYPGGGLGDFTLGPDNQSLNFTDYKGYGHSAGFATLRPPPAGAYRLDSLPAAPGAADLAGTVWAGTVPGTSLGGFSGNPVILHFTGDSTVYVTRTYDVDTEEEKRRLFSYSLDGETWTIAGIGSFNLDAGAGALSFADFPGAGGLVCGRIQ
jgi:hypothetical protein